MSERAPPGSAGLRAQRLLALFVAGWVLFDFPLLGLALGRGPEATIFGLPRLPVLLFAAWAALIVALAWLMERRSGEPDEPTAAVAPADGASAAAREA